MSIRPQLSRKLLVSSLLSLSLLSAGCRPESDAPRASSAGEQPTGLSAPAPAPEQVVLEDVIENDPRYLIGISYPHGMEKYPGLATALQRYAEAARADTLEAAQGAAPAAGGAPYDLSLSFNTLAETPDVVAVAADGSSYTGGAHGNPLVARFVWLPRQDRMLEARALIPDPRGWREVSAYVREQLHSALSQRIDADDLAPAEREQVMRSAAKMIDEGTAPDPENFAQFEPVLGEGGTLRALRFVFPPYQVGPYSDGVQTVEVPAAVLLPHVATEFRGLFAD